MATKHTKACNEAYVRYRFALDKYKAQWPSFCRSCNATGVVEYFDDPIGEPWSSSQRFTEACEECMAQGVCPRCGEKVWDEEDFDNLATCPECGWEEENSAAAPEQPECECWRRK